jgi:HPr kinase/phosphorylase
MRQTSVELLFERNRERLKLTWVCGSRSTAITFYEEVVVPGDLVGYLNLIHPERLHVVGREEIAWSEKQPPGKVERVFAELISARPPAIIIADGCQSSLVVDAAGAADIPVMSTPLPAPTVIDLVRAWLARQLADRVEMHGVMIDVLGMGVLITGESGVGKSELALELVSRGHGLVADDVVEVAHVAPNTLEGRAPEMLKDFLEVRGLGVLNIRTIFGETACRRKMKINLVVHLQRPRRGEADMIPRLPIDAQIEEVLGVPLRKVTIPVAAGRNLAVLVEAAVRSAILTFRGLDSTREFVERQRRALEED